jgi:hypothetical protein
VTSAVPEGWGEAYRGPCLRADLLLAVLESHGLHPVCQQFSPQVWWSGSLFEDCRIYLPEEELDRARQIIESDQPPTAPG